MDGHLALRYIHDKEDSDGMLRFGLSGLDSDAVAMYSVHLKQGATYIFEADFKNGRFEDALVDGDVAGNAENVQFYELGQTKLDIPIEYMKKNFSTGNRNFKANWIPHVYTIKFDGNGNDSGTMNDIQATYDVPVPIPATGFEKKGYHSMGYYAKNGDDTSDGWYEDGAIPDGWHKMLFTEGMNISTLQPEQNGVLTLEVQWEITVYNIEYINTFNGDNKYSTYTYAWAIGELEGDAPKTYTIFDEVILPKVVGAKSKNFQGWCDNKELTGEIYTIIPRGSTGTKTFYGKFTYNRYNITVDLDGGTIDGLTGSQTFNGEYDDTVSFNDPYPTRDGYDFVGWGKTDTDVFQYGGDEISFKKRWFPSIGNPSGSWNEWEISCKARAEGYCNLFAAPLVTTHGETTVMSFWAKATAGAELAVLGNYNSFESVEWTNPAGNKGTGDWEHYTVRQTSPSDMTQYVTDTGYVRVYTDKDFDMSVSSVDIYNTMPNFRFKFGDFLGQDYTVKAIWKKQ